MTGFAERFNTVKCLKSSLLTLKTLPKPGDCPSLTQICELAKVVFKFWVVICEKVRTIHVVSVSRSFQSTQEDVVCTLRVRCRDKPRPIHILIHHPHREPKVFGLYPFLEEIVNQVIHFRIIFRKLCQILFRPNTREEFLLVRRKTDNDGNGLRH